MPSYTTTSSGVIYIAPQDEVRPDASQVRDWLVWSIINLFVGWGGGLLPLIFSIVCRVNKNNNDQHTARIISILALVFNIFATVGGVICWICLIIFFVFLRHIYTQIQSN